MKNKVFRKMTAFFLTAVLIAPILFFAAPEHVRAAASLPDCGDNLSCLVTGSGEDYTLHIHVKDRSETYNPITNYYYEKGGLDAFPWKDYRPFISTVNIDPGVSSIPEWAFADMPALKTVCIPRSLKSISENAFRGTPRIDTLHYGGTEAEWQELSSTYIYNAKGGNTPLLTHRGRNCWLLDPVTVKLPRKQYDVNLKKQFDVLYMYAIPETLKAAEAIDGSIRLRGEGYSIDGDGSCDIILDYSSVPEDTVYVRQADECTMTDKTTVTLSDDAVYELEKSYNVRFLPSVTFDFTPVAPKGILMPDEAIEVPAGSGYTLPIQISPAEAPQDFKVTFANSKIVKYTDMNIIGIEMGKTKMTVSTPDGKIKLTRDVRVLFNDVVNKKLAAYNAIYWGADHDIVKGYKTYFDIDGNVTRGQVVLFLWRAAGKPPAKNQNLKFKDAADIEKMAPDYKKAILWGSEQGIVMGYTSGANAGKFLPNAPCTRSEIVTFLWRYGGQKPAKSGAKAFPDVPKTHKHYKAIMWASSYGITTGFSDGKFKPDQKCTRGQCATFLYRMLK